MKSGVIVKSIMVNGEKKIVNFSEIARRYNCTIDFFSLEKISYKDFATARKNKFNLSALLSDDDPFRW